MFAWRFTAVVAALALAGVATAESQEVSPPMNRIINPGAESGSLSPWTGGGFEVGQYGSGSMPSTEQSARDGLGERYFAAVRGGETLAQDVDVSDLASTIDRSGYRFLAGAYLGAAGGSRDDPQIVLQPLDTLGAALVS